MNAWSVAIRCVTAGAVLLGAMESAHAQDRPVVELAFGYSLLKLHSGPLATAGVGTLFPAGWFFEAAVPLSDGIALVGQLDGQYRWKSKSLDLAGPPGAAGYTLRAHSVLTGARVIGRRADGLTAIFHLLAGTTRLGLTLSAAAPVPGTLVPLVGPEGARSQFTLQAGGGWDYPLRRGLSARVTADYVRVSTADGPTHGYRVAVGWVVPLRR